MTTSRKFHQTNSGLSILSTLIGSAVLVVLVTGAMLMAGNYVANARHAQLMIALSQIRHLVTNNTNCAMTVAAQVAACNTNSAVDVWGQDTRKGNVFISSAGTTFNEGAYFDFQLRATCNRTADYYRLAYEVKVFLKNGTKVIDQIPDPATGEGKDYSTNWQPLFAGGASDGLACSASTRDVGGAWYVLTAFDSKFCPTYCANISRTNVPDPQGYRCVSASLCSSTANSFAGVCAGTFTDLSNIDAYLGTYCPAAPVDSCAGVSPAGVGVAATTTGCFCL